MQIKLYIYKNIHCTNHGRMINTHTWKHHTVTAIHGNIIQSFDIKKEILVTENTFKIIISKTHMQLILVWRVHLKPIKYKDREKEICKNVSMPCGSWKSEIKINCFPKCLQATFTVRKRKQLKAPSIYLLKLYPFFPKRKETR